MNWSSLVDVTMTEFVTLRCVELPCVYADQIPSQPVILRMMLCVLQCYHGDGVSQSLLLLF